MYAIINNNEEDTNLQLSKLVKEVFHVHVKIILAIKNRNEPDWCVEVAILIDESRITFA
jgi:hypothetical protein